MLLVGASLVVASGEANQEQVVLPKGGLVA